MYLHNPAPVKKDELAKNVFTKSNNTPTLSPAIFWATSAQTPIST